MSSRIRILLPLIAGLILTLGCSSKSAASTTTEEIPQVTISGTIKFTRVPTIKSTTGIPLGLETDSTKFLLDQPARGVSVRVYQYVTETEVDGSLKKFFKLSGLGVTGSDGKYTLIVNRDKPIMIEVVSSFTPSQSGQNPINIIADPNGMTSAINNNQRLRYVLRKAVDGTGATSTNVAPTSTITSAASTVDFSVGVNDKWLLSDVSYDTGTNIAPRISNASLESTGTGSRILGIIDNIYNFLNVYNTSASFDTLDLHYFLGRREPRGTYVDYDRSAYPLSGSTNTAYDFQTGKLHYFGSIGGSSANDDAWDDALIYGLLARNNLYVQIYFGSLFLKDIPPLMPTFNENPQINNVHPMLAFIQGQSDVLVASLLKSPFLADTFSGTASVRDIRDLSLLSSLNKSIYSASTIAALGWGILLQSNSITAPGTPTTWATIDLTKTGRYFGIVIPANIVDTPNIYNHLARLQETKAVAEPVDLKAIFTDTFLTSYLAPFNIVWPRPVTPNPLYTFVYDWDLLSTFAKTPIPLSMDNAILLSGKYPNATSGELAYARFSLTADSAFNLSVSSSASIPNGSVSIYFVDAGYTYVYNSASTPTRIVLKGNSSPYRHTIIVRVNSPLVKINNTNLTITLTPTN